MSDFFEMNCRLHGLPPDASRAEVGESSYRLLKGFQFEQDDARNNGIIKKSDVDDIVGVVHRKLFGLSPRASSLELKEASQRSVEEFIALKHRFNQRYNAAALTN